MARRRAAPPAVREHRQVTGSNTTDHCHDGCALLVDLADDAEVSELAAGWADRVRLLAATSTSHPDLSGLLVRPDGYVAWATGTGDDRASLATALIRWFGAPEVARQGVTA